MSRLALLQLARAPHGMWTSWDGRGSPVHPWAACIVLLRDGSTRRGLAAEFTWVHDPAPDGDDPEDIVAFRVRVPARIALCGRLAA